MSKRAERHEAERLARREAYLASRQTLQSAQTTQSAETAPTVESAIEVAAELASESTASEARVAANQANAQHSTGPSTPEGKATVSQNRTTHGLTGKFSRLPNENPYELSQLLAHLNAEYKPETETEQNLVDSMVQHYWRMQRAIRFQDEHIFTTRTSEPDAKCLSLYLRYQTTHERSYYKAMRELQNIQKQKRKEQLGFESQKRAEEMHEAKTRLIHAKAQTMEVEASCRQVMEAPIPGTHNIPFEQMSKACGDAIARLASNERREAAAA